MPTVFLSLATLTLRAVGFFAGEILWAKGVGEQICQNSLLVCPVVVNEKDLQILAKLIHELSMKQEEQG
jgi:hypothetical protein